MTEKDVDILKEKDYFSTKNLNLNQNPEVEIRYGVTCSKCNRGTFDYDGMLNLVCSNCGYYTGGCFT